jgi:hypothetical protein
LTPLESQFLSILQAHRGLRHAVSVPSMAAQLGVLTRTAQDIKKTLVEQHGISIGSSCGKQHGWYLPETQSEVEATMRQYRNRVKSLCILIAKTTAAANRSGVMRQLALEFEQEELSNER